MAMEQLEVPSKAYLIRWVDCAPGNTIHWSIKPHKKSLNFGLFRHPGNNTSIRPPPTARSESSVSTVKEVKRPATNGRQRSNEGDVKLKMQAAGLQEVYWHGKCEAEKVTTGTYKVETQGGMFGLVFDNTFSKQIAKTATFVLLTYPSNAPPPASHALQQAGAEASPSKSGLASYAAASEEAFSIHGDDQSTHSGSGFQTGVLKKRKRKRHQGYARRFFSLDFTSCTLSYYHNRESSALRGAIPLSLAAISASEKGREITIDSGAEVWHLRANTDKEWETWKSALERAAQQAAKATTGGHPQSAYDGQAVRQSDQHVILEERGWAGVESLLGRVSGIRDAVRRLATSAEMPLQSLSATHASEAASSTTSVASAESAEKPKKQPFWKRKQSAPGPTSVPTLHPKDATTRKSVSTVAALSTSTAGLGFAPPPSPRSDIANNLQALLMDLDSVVADFSKLVAENKKRRWLSNRMSEQITPTANPRMSMESTTSDEFFDAEDDLDGERVVMMEDDGSGHSSADDAATDDEESDGEDSFDETPEAPIQPPQGADAEKRDLSPLPLTTVPRRTTVPEAKVLPPSLIGFLRKNVGKDLSTIAMPVSANEPLSLLQRTAEQLEYSELLDQALEAPVERGERLLYVAAFAVSAFSNCRVKERSIRKPFNPMLGETFELIREDKGFRFIAEKVSHRPVIMALHAESASWTFTQSPQPTQKFWGKSAELNTAGRVRIMFPRTGDSFSYTMATSFLRNVIAGEKYVEPTGSMHIHHENTGEKAVVVFKPTKGMFGGRSEELSVSAHSPTGIPYPLGLTGKWTESLTLTSPEGSKVIWSVGQLVDKPVGTYGLPQFAAQLNEITSIERGSLPPTDSRLRPDQRMAENGELDDAEEVKLRLEEEQRKRRKVMEEQGRSWQPRWFVKKGVYADEEVWGVVEGERGYWTARKKEEWVDVEKVFGEGSAT